MLAHKARCSTESAESAVRMNIFRPHVSGVLRVIATSAAEGAARTHQLPKAGAARARHPPKVLRVHVSYPRQVLRARVICRRWVMCVRVICPKEGDARARQLPEALHVIITTRQLRNLNGLGEVYGLASPPSPRRIKGRRRGKTLAKEKKQG